MRKDAEGSGPNSFAQKESTNKGIAKQVGKSNELVSAADIWATLTEAQQKEIKQWFYAVARCAQGNGPARSASHAHRSQTSDASAALQ